MLCLLPLTSVRVTSALLLACLTQLRARRLGKTVIADAVRFTLGDAVSSVRLQNASEAINHDLKQHHGKDASCTTQVCFKFRENGSRCSYVCVRKHVAGSGRCQYYAATLQQPPSPDAWLREQLPSLTLVRAATVYYHRALRSYAVRTFVRCLPACTRCWSHSGATMICALSARS